MTRFYFDTEFIEDGRTIDLVSIGIVTETAGELFLVNRDAELHRASEWMRTHVLPQLPPYGSPQWKTKREIRELVEAFFVRHSSAAEFVKPEIWAFYADYDWVALCQLWGTMMDLPRWMPRYCRDLKQLAVSLGNPPLPEQGEGEHGALADAKWNRSAHEFLIDGWKTQSLVYQPPY